MKFIPCPLAGAYVIEMEKRGDERGFFARSFCQQEFAQYNLQANIVQANTSFNRAQGTLRGLHYQLPPKAEDKLVRCTRGAIFDVIVDLRPDSPTFLLHFSIELTENSFAMLYVPKGFAHGLLTLAPETEVLYLMTEYYAEECGRGLRYNDPALGIKWPVEPTVISDRDKNYPDYNPAIHLR